jgi:S1-C subfamily serine protease
LFSPQGHVLGLTPNSAGSGIEIGDQIVRINGAVPSFADTTDFGYADFEVEHRPGDVLFMDVVGASGARSVRLTCGDAAPVADALVSLGDALAAGSWSECEQRASQLDRLLGSTPAMASIRRKCFELAAWPIDTAYEANTLLNLSYEESRRAVDSAPYAPGGIDAVRADLLTAISELRSAGKTDLAQDLESRLASAEHATPSKTAIDVAEPSPPHAASLDPRALYRQIRESVVLIKSLDRFGNPLALGSGFFIADGSVIVSNHHVVEGAASLSARTAGGHIFQIDTALAVDPEHDLVLLESPEIGPPLELQLADPEIGIPVLAIGNPSGLEGTISAGIVSGLRSKDSQTYYQITAPISPGSSGGPVVNERSEVIGVATFFLREAQALSFAVPAREIARLLPNRSRLALRDIPSGATPDDPTEESPENSPLTGNWTGSLEQELGGASATFRIFMKLFQEDTQVSGLSILFLPESSAYAVMFLVGTLMDDQLEFQETTIVEQELPEQGYWCIKQGLLGYDAAKASLSGRWSAPSCAPGTIYLERAR